MDYKCLSFNLHISVLGDSADNEICALQFTTFVFYFKDR